MARKNAKGSAPSATSEGAATPSGGARGRSKKRGRRGRPRRGTAGGTRRTAAKRAGTAGHRRTRTQYSDEQRRQILATAKRDGLTATQVEKRFGVTPVTYYSWRKKTGANRLRSTGARTAGARRGPGSSAALDFAETIRSEIRLRIRDLLPELIKSEMEGALAQSLGSGRRRGRPRGRRRAARGAR